MNCPGCDGEVLDIDVKCKHCGRALGATGAQRMLGQVVLGQYELIDVLGQGGMSVVFKGKHRMTDQEVALKILPPELAAHSQVKSRFLDEAKALAALDHPNIVHLYNFGQENGLFVLAMQYVQGHTWERIILENKRMTWQESLKVTIDVLRALEYAHSRGIVHRDMKPSNVLVRAHDGMATVMDFGIAKMTTSTKLTATGQTMGTVRYMSPEQVRGQEVDLRTDLYSLGATLYESLTGDTPFDGDTHFEIMTKHLSEPAQRPSQRGIEVPRLVEDALMRSLAKKPADRFPDAREMRKILEGALKEGDVGLSQTARLAVALPTPAGPRAATPITAGDLADQLEPGNTGAATAVKRAKKSKVPWFVGLAVLLAGGAVATAVLMKKDGPAGFQTRTEIRNVVFAAGDTIEGVRIESAGKTAPAAIATAYQASVVRKLGPLNVRSPVDEIVAIPAAAFCEATVFPGQQMPKNCGTQTYGVALTNGGRKRIVIVDDPSQTEPALDTAVLDAACYFDPESEACRAFKKTLRAPGSAD